ncbi:MAG: dUTP diphosphatase [Nanoarchaeota archaeon]|nr:dUTP diphosphatase [Nanoarchaeota archaeon]
MKLRINIKKLNQEAKIPIYASEEAAGCDFYSNEDLVLKPNETKIVGTGIAIELPKATCMQMWDRSGLGVKGIHRYAGLIDSDYRGEIKIVLHNSSNQDLEIKKHERIAQGVILSHFQAEFVEDKINETKRGENGFHSTGKD